MLAKENMTITELAKIMSEKSGKNYNVNGLSQKLVRNTLRYDEFKLIIEILGYSMKFKKD